MILCEVYHTGTNELLIKKHFPIVPQAGHHITIKDPDKSGSSYVVDHIEHICEGAAEYTLRINVF